jgi:hypothetical protein
LLLYSSYLTLGVPNWTVNINRTASISVSSNIHQLCVIITEAVEENDPTDNAATHAQVDKSRSSSKKEKEKIHVSTGEWRIIMSARNHGTRYPPTQEEKS